jgi:hypothetical protein
VLPDLPDVEILAAHLHRLSPQEVLDGSLLEPELDEVLQTWSATRNPACIEEPHPAPLDLQVGVGIPVELDAVVTMEFSVRVVEEP